MDLAPITPDTRPKTEQEVFNYVVRFLRKQGRKSMADDGNPNSCAYRTADGLKCAAGCLLTNEDYDPGIEGRSVSAPDVRKLFRALYPGAMDVLDAMQSVHDCYDVAEWEGLWADLAARRELTVPAPA